MAATKLQKGWTGVQLATTTIAHVNSCSFDKGGSLLEYLGDNAIMPTVIVVQSSRYHASVTSADVNTVMSFNVGDGGSFVATSPDAKAATGGSITFTLANSVVQNANMQGSWGAFATSTLALQAASSDGTTPPLSLSLA